jgi:choline-glycine betaine transporter
VIIGVVGGVSMISVALGLDRGIKRLSNLNIWMAVALLAFILVAGSTLPVIKGTIESVGTYFMNLPALAFWNDTFAATGWQSSWTVFYWAWTISWSPFVGIFIARISKGRTIRQFVSGVLAVPAGFSVIWFGIFGHSAFQIELNGQGGLVETVVEQEDIPGALFAFLENFPATGFVSVVAIILVTIFFITSVDSAALVTDTMANGHEDFNPLGQRIFWAIAIGLITATLLIFSGSGGLAALEQFVVLIGLPFFIMGYFQMYAIYRAVSEDASQLPPERTRRWKKVLPPEELERRRAAEDEDDEGAVTEPEAAEEAPVMRDPYLEERPIGPRGTLAARTGSAPLRPTRSLTDKRRFREEDE